MISERVLNHVVPVDAIEVEIVANVRRVPRLIYIHKAQEVVGRHGVKAGAKDETGLVIEKRFFDLDEVFGVLVLACGMICLVDSFWVASHAVLLLLHLLGFFVQVRRLDVLG